MTSVLVTLLTVVIAVLVVLVVGLLRSNAQIVQALHDQGSRAPHRRRCPAADITGTTPEGDPIRIAVVGASLRTLVVFLTSSCTTCARIWDALGDPRRVRRLGEGRTVVVTKGEEAEIPSRVRPLAPPGVPVVMSTDAWSAYGVDTAPFCAFVDGASGTVISEGRPDTWDDVVAMSGLGIVEA